MRVRKAFFPQDLYGRIVFFFYYIYTSELADKLCARAKHCKKEADTTVIEQKTEKKHEQQLASCSHQPTCKAAAQKIVTPRINMFSDNRCWCT